jgi:thioredoxin-related protein
MPPSDPGVLAGSPGTAGARPGGATRSGPTRAMPIVLLAIAGVLLVARVALGIFEQVRPLERASRVEWREPAAGEAEARAADRLMLYCFTRESDPVCRTLSREVFAERHSAEAIQTQFVPIRVLDLKREEGRNPPDVARLEQQYGVTEFPTLVVAHPLRFHFEKQAGYTGSLATTQFLARAASRILLPHTRMQSGMPADSAAGRP